MECTSTNRKAKPMTSEMQQPKSLDDTIREAAEKDPQAALEIALAGNQRLTSEIERLNLEQRSLADVTVEADGFHAANLAAIYRLGKLYAGSNMVPEDYRNKPNDCAIVCQMAVRWHLDPFQVFSQVYFVHGKPGLEAKLMVTLLNKSGALTGRLRYRFEGDGGNGPDNLDFGCRAVGTDAVSGEEVVGPKVDWRMVKAEGWLSKKGSKWQSMPEVMFHYRAAALFCRLHYPDIMMGLSTTDELQDIGKSRVTTRGEMPKAITTETEMPMIDLTTAEVKPEPSRDEKEAPKKTEHDRKKEAAEAIAQKKKAAKPDQEDKPKGILPDKEPETPVRTTGELCRDILAELEGSDGMTGEELAELLGEEPPKIVVSLTELYRADAVQSWSVDDSPIRYVIPKAAVDLEPADVFDLMNGAETVADLRGIRKSAYANEPDGGERDKIRACFRENEARIKGASQEGGSL